MSRVREDGLQRRQYYIFVVSKSTTNVDVYCCRPLYARLQQLYIVGMRPFQASQQTLTGQIGGAHICRFCFAGYIHTGTTTRSLQQPSRSFKPIGLRGKKSSLKKVETPNDSYALSPSRLLLQACERLRPRASCVVPRMTSHSTPFFVILTLPAVAGRPVRRSHCNAAPTGGGCVLFRCAGPAKTSQAGKKAEQKTATSVPGPLSANAHHFDYHDISSPRASDTNFGGFEPFQAIGGVIHPFLPPREIDGG